MNFNNYQYLASRTAPKKPEENQDVTYLLANFAMGLAGEAGETVDYLKKVIFHSHQLDIDNVKKELGDVLWYVSQLARLCDIDLNDVAVTNIEKLKQRYPEGFSSDASIHRVEYEQTKAD